MQNFGIRWVRTRRVSNFYNQMIFWPLEHLSHWERLIIVPVVQNQFWTMQWFLVYALPEPEISVSAVPITLTQQTYSSKSGYTVLSWKAKPSRGYAIKYSDDKGVTWHTAFGIGSGASVKTTAATHVSGTSVQWIDHGPGAIRTEPTLYWMYKVFELPVGTYPLPVVSEPYTYQNNPPSDDCRSSYVGVIVRCRHERECLDK